MLKKILFMLILIPGLLMIAYSAGSGSSGDVKVESIEATGLAKLLKGNIDKTKLIALRAAYARAVKNQTGSNIGDITRYQDLKLLSSIIESRSKGFIRKYAITKEGLSDNDPQKYEVAIKATVVNNGKIDKGEKEGLKKFLELLGKPKILVILPEKEVGDGSIIITKKDASGSPIRSIEVALARALSQYGYEAMTSDDLVPSKNCSKKAIEEAKTGNTAKAKEVARHQGVDLALIGITKFSADKTEALNIKQVMVTGEAAAKALIVSSGKLIEVFHSTQKVSNPQRLQAFSDCADRLALQMAKTLAWKIQQILAGDYRETSITVKGVSLVQAKKIKAELTNYPAIDKVSATQYPAGSDKTAVFTVYTGFIPMDSKELVGVCTGALKANPQLVKADKFEIVLALKKAKVKKLGDNF
ncbi:MAG: hypothetical protein GY757_28180 [bacterium]|nr:hypothetical protein [bacterium]